MEPAGGQGGNPPEKYKITVEGKVLEVTMPELIALAQQGQHYTQNMQGLREKERGLQSAVEARANEQFEAWLKELADNPEFAATVGQVGNPPAAHAPEASDPQFQALVKTIGELQKSIEDLRGGQQKSEQERVTSEVNRLMEGLKGKYPHMDRFAIERRFMVEASESDNPAEVFERFAKESEENWGKSKQAIIDEYIKSKENPPAITGEIGSGAAGGAEGTPPPPPPKDFAEARERGEKFFEAVRGKNRLVP